jgi:hypothetical protein
MSGNEVYSQVFLHTTEQGFAQGSVGQGQQIKKSPSTVRLVVMVKPGFSAIISGPSLSLVVDLNAFPYQFPRFLVLFSSQIHLCPDHLRNPVLW